MDESDQNKVASHFRNIYNITKQLIVCRTNSSFRKILEEVDPNKVFILTNNASHYELAKMCIENRNDTLIEKPVVTRLKELSDLRRLAKIKKVQLFEAYHQLYREETNGVIDMIIRNPSRSQNTRTNVLIRGGTGNSFPRHRLDDGFKRKVFAGGGVLLDQGSHFICIAILMLISMKVFTYDDSNDIRIKEMQIDRSDNESVESEFTAVFEIKEIRFEIFLTYEQYIHEEVIIRQGNSKEYRWPYEQTNKSSLAFKQIVDDFLDNKCRIGTSFDSDMTAEAIKYTVEIIEKLYAGVCDKG